MAAMEIWGNESMWQHHLHAYTVDTLPTVKSQVRAAYEGQDWLELAHLLHKCVGSCSQLGAMRMHTTASSFECVVLEAQEGLHSHDDMEMEMEMAMEAALVRF